MYTIGKQIDDFDKYSKTNLVKADNNIVLIKRSGFQFKKREENISPFRSSSTESA